MTNLVPATGSVCLGIVFGWLVRYCMRRFKKFSAATLTTIASVLVGGVAIKFLNSDPTVLWFYPIGLLIGFIVYSVVGYFAIRFGGSKYDQVLFCRVDTERIPKKLPNETEREFLERVEPLIPASPDSSSPSQSSGPE
jgi:hypothetical protein